MDCDELQEEDDEEQEQGMDCDELMVEVVVMTQVLELDGEEMEVGLRVVLELEQGWVEVLEQQ